MRRGTLAFVAVVLAVAAAVPAMSWQGKDHQFIAVTSAGLLAKRAPALSKALLKQQVSLEKWAKECDGNPATPPMSHVLKLETVEPPPPLDWVFVPQPSTKKLPWMIELYYDRLVTCLKSGSPIEQAAGFLSHFAGDANIPPHVSNLVGSYATDPYHKGYENKLTAAATGLQTTAKMMARKDLTEASYSFPDGRTAAIQETIRNSYQGVRPFMEAVNAHPETPAAWVKDLKPTHPYGQYARSMSFTARLWDAAWREAGKPKQIK